MKTPPDEVHLKVDDAHPLIPAPEGYWLRLYAKRKGGRIYVDRSPNRDGPWEETGPMDMRFLHFFLYEQGLVDLYDEPGDDEPIDMMAYRSHRHRAG